MSTIWHIDRQRVQVVPLAPALDFVPTNRKLSTVVVQKVFDVKTPYILYVGRSIPRKNLQRFLAAYRILRSRAFSTGLMLVTSDTSTATTLVRELNLTNYVRVVSNCPPELLPHVYSAAEVLVYPSLYEGFGLPLLEAMACGTPVLAAAAGAVPETVGDAAILTDPLDVAGMANGLARVLRDGDYRAFLRDRGRRRARQVTWVKTARATRRVLSDVVQARQHQRNAT
jgi:glycosyltransferase involved in cell wall biosynthesis